MTEGKSYWTGLAMGFLDQLTDQSVLSWTDGSEDNYGATLVDGSGDLNNGIAVSVDSTGTWTKQALTEALGFICKRPEGGENGIR